MLLYSIMCSPKDCEHWDYLKEEKIFHSLKETLMYLFGVQMDIMACGDKVNNYNFAIISSIQFRED